MSDTAVTLALGEDFPEIRAAVRHICAGFPGAYWREREAPRNIPRPSSPR